MRKRLAIAFALLFLVAAQAQAFWGGSADLLEIFGNLDLDGPTAANVEALERYAEANSGEEGVDEALLRLGSVYSGKKEFEKAGAFYSTLLEEFPDSRFRTDASYELALIDYRTGKLEEASALIEPIVSAAGASFSLRARAARLLKEIEAASLGLMPLAETPAIGLLLPLKGDYASFGEEALQGVLLASNAFGKGPYEVEVIVKDTGAGQGSVERAVTELASVARVTGIVGPLLSSTAAEAARDAQRLGVPVITLSQKEGVTSAGDFVFRNFLTLEDQARALADYSAGKGFKRFAVLHPQTNYGVELAKHFDLAVKERAGAVVRQAPYAPGTTDFGAEVKRIFGVKATERMEGRKKVTEFIQTVRIDALFLPDSPEAAALIVPYLDYYGITGVQLLGASGWNSPRLIELSGKAVEGAVFVDGFFAGSSRPGTMEFTGKFEEAYGKAPGLIAAQAYDAAMMLISAAKGQGSDREAVAQRLRATTDFKGATGSTSFNARREAQKALFFLTVDGGRIVEAAQ